MGKRRQCLGWWKVRDNTKTSTGRAGQGRAGQGRAATTAAAPGHGIGGGVEVCCVYPPREGTGQI
jgi:hypothetical protein